MNTLQIPVSIVGFGLIGWIIWYFWLWKNESVSAEATAGGVQEIDITVQGGYRPAEIVVKAEQLVHLRFTRRESSACSEEIVFPDFGIRTHLPQDQTVTIDVTPKEAGEYEFTCGMNMLHGKLIAR
jgi:plastocyanin domain-containing protein